MKRVALLLTIAFGYALAVLVAPAYSQNDRRIERLQFSPGTTGTIVNDRITGYEVVRYALGAGVGQRMMVTLTTSHTATYFNVIQPSLPDGPALAMSELSATNEMVPEINRFDGILPESGDYAIEVYMVRAAARRGEVSDFTLSVEIAPRDPDYADGLSGGPDYWEVTGVPANDTLNVRAGPGTDNAVIGELSNQDLVRNLGCQMVGQSRWCQIEAGTEMKFSGWVNGRYLREASTYPAVTDSSGPDADIPNYERPVGGVLPAGSSSTASTIIPCERPGTGKVQCDAGIVREGNGNGFVMIFWPNSGNRVLYIENGDVVRYDEAEADGGAELSVTRQGDIQKVTIGDAHFEIFDAMIFGG